MRESDMFCASNTASPARHAPYVGMTVGEAASRRSTARQRQGGDGTGAVAQTCHFPPSSVQKMPTATLTFDLPEEQGDYDAARLGRQMVSTIWEIDQHLRSICKHGEPTTAERHLAEAIRAMIRNVPSDNPEDVT